MTITLLTLALAQCVCPADDLINCGHRGSGTNVATNPWPENTIPGFVAAGERGADMVETDAQLTADGVVVLLHDDDVDRTTDGTGCIGDLDLTAARALDAGGTAMPGQGVQIPTLADALGATEVGFNIELKVHGAGDCPATDVDALARAVVDAVHADPTPRDVWITSFSAEALDAVRALDPELPVGLITKTADLSIAIDGGYDGVGPRLDLAVAEGYVEDAHAAGLAVNPWTAVSADTTLPLVEADVEMIISEDPAMVDLVVAGYCESWCAENWTEPTGDGKDDAGCGCATGPGPSAGWLALLLVALRRRAS